MKASTQKGRLGRCCTSLFLRFVIQYCVFSSRVGHGHQLSRASFLEGGGGHSSPLPESPPPPKLFNCQLLLPLENFLNEPLNWWGVVQVSRIYCMKIKSMKISTKGSGGISVNFAALKISIHTVYAFVRHPREIIIE